MFRKKTKTASRQAPPSKKELPPTFSYYSSINSGNLSGSDQLNTTIKRPESGGRGSKRLRHTPSYLAAGLIIISLLYALSLDINPKIVIGNQTTANNLARSSETYRTAIQSILSKTMLNRTKLTINTSEVAKSIQDNFPEIDRVEVSLPLLGRRPIIGLDLGQPTVVVVGHNGSFIVGQDGRALIRTLDLANSDKLNLPIVYDQSGLTMEQGKAVMPKQYVEFITTVLDQLAAKHVAVESITLPTVANELHVKPANVPYLIKYNLQGDARLQTGTYLATRDRLAKEGATLQEYVDVRIENRAYYK